MCTSCDQSLWWYMLFWPSFFAIFAIMISIRKNKISWWLLYYLFFILSNFVIWSSVWWMRWLMSFDNSADDIIALEDMYDVSVPMVWLLYDNRYLDWNYQLFELDDKLGPRLYHITLSPDHYNAQQVADGVFDEQYLMFFRTIKGLRRHVMFRTMHEMNGWWYPRSWDPQAFVQARRHVVSLAEEAGVRNQIQFVFSVNHRDMPTTSETPSQQAPLVQCTPFLRQQTWCLAWEDYWPGDDYVDIIGVTLYNRGKATSNRLRLSPRQILFDTRWQTWERLIAAHKPIVIDEIATTAVRYPQYYNPELSRSLYLQDYYRKNKRISDLDTLLQEYPDIVATLYFNRDYTQGLLHPTRGEADWSLYHPQTQKIYFGIFDFLPWQWSPAWYQHAFWHQQRDLTHYAWLPVPPHLVDDIKKVHRIVAETSRPRYIVLLLQQKLTAPHWQEVLWYVAKIVDQGEYITSLQKEQNNVKEITGGHECGMKVKCGKKILEGDTLQFFVYEENKIE